MPINFGYHFVQEGLFYQPVKFCKKKLDFRNKNGFVCYLLFKEAKNHMFLFYCDRNFDSLHINVVMFVPRRHSKIRQFFTHKR